MGRSKTTLLSVQFCSHLNFWAAAQRIIYVSHADIYKLGKVVLQTIVCALRWVKLVADRRDRVPGQVGRGQGVPSRVEEPA
jgi:hypothetical protein